MSICVLPHQQYAPNPLRVPSILLPLAAPCSPHSDTDTKKANVPTIPENIRKAQAHTPSEEKPQKPRNTVNAPTHASAEHRTPPQFAVARGGLLGEARAAQAVAWPRAHPRSSYSPGPKPLDHPAQVHSKDELELHRLER